MSSLGGGACNPKSLWEISGPFERNLCATSKFFPIPNLSSGHVAERDSEKGRCIAVASERTYS
jgi:hypothetical protein